jgi:eukaryotic-like serine/threonine-protein kinase
LRTPDLEPGHFNKQGDQTMRSKVGHYEIVQELGRGGMGVVYKGFEPALNRFVAIKLMSENLAHDAQVVERFLREARSMAQLNDPHIIQIYLISEDQGQPFFAMEFVEGESLSQTLRREGKIDANRAAGIIAQAAQGLSVAHDRGVVHRDIKPANLMLTPRGLIKVADFGIALANHDVEKKLTGTGEFVGTPGYLSPEVCLGKQVDQRSDVFSLGIVFFEMLAGRMPFTDQSPLGLMLEVVKADIPDVRSLGAAVSPELVQVLNKMLAKDPDDRYRSCHDVLADLSKAGVVSSTVSVNAPAPGVTSASTLPQGARQANAAQAPSAPVGATAPRIQVVQPAGAPPIPPPSVGPAAPAYVPAPAYVQGYAPQAARKSNAPLIGIAAGALLALGAGAFATRQYWMPNQNSGGGTAVPVAAAQPVDATPSANTPVSSAPTIATSNAPDVTVGSNDPTSTSPTVAVESANAPTTPEVVKTLEVAVNDQGNAIQAQDAEIERLKAENAKLVAAQSTSNSDTAIDVREPLAGVRERVQAANKRDLAPTIASNTPVRTAAPPVVQSRTGVVVVALGDGGVAGAAEAMIEDALRDGGYTVIDEDAFPAIANLRGRGSAANVLSAAKAAGISALVVVNAKRTGSRQLDFYGQSETQLLGTLEVKAFGTANGSSINSFSEPLEYVSPRASEVAREAVRSHLGQLVSRLSAHRGRG